MFRTYKLGLYDGFTFPSSIFFPHFLARVDIQTIIEYPLSTVLRVLRKLIQRLYEVKISAILNPILVKHFWYTGTIEKSSTFDHSTQLLILTLYYTADDLRWRPQLCCSESLSRLSKQNSRVNIFTLQIEQKLFFLSLSATSQLHSYGALPVLLLLDFISPLLKRHKQGKLLGKEWKQPLYLVSQSLNTIRNNNRFQWPS